MSNALSFSHSSGQRRWQDILQDLRMDVPIFFTQGFYLYEVALLLVVVDHQFTGEPRACFGVIEAWMPLDVLS
uniref:Uncharacterized protein n=1 Tax=Thermosporothrix sp. COM3 TaxID=2490863 RepID=A0A455SLW1_9CHLR|nr:hypothetical protein KTC_19260 [Thermosporothrix sp. COM3]